MRLDGRTLIVSSGVDENAGLIISWVDAFANSKPNHSPNSKSMYRRWHESHPELAMLDLDPRVVEAEILTRLFSVGSTAAQLSIYAAECIAKHWSGQDITDVRVDARGLPIAAELLTASIRQKLDLPDATKLAPRSNTAVAIAAASAVIVAHSLGQIVSAIRGVRMTPPSAQAVGDESFVTYPQAGNVSRFIWDYIRRSISANPDYHALVLVLGPGFRRLEFPADIDSSRLTILRPCGIIEIEAGITLLRSAQVFAQAHLDASRSLGLAKPGRRMIKAMGRVHRSLAHRRWIAQLPAGANRAMTFGMEWSADGTAATLALQQQGYVTIHWLHGSPTSELMFQGYSSIALLDTPPSRAMFEKLGTYGACVEMPSVNRERTALRPRPPTGMVVITNCLAYSEFNIDPLLRFYLRTLLELVASACAADQPLLWRPHPSSTLLEEDESFARKLGYTIDRSTPLVAQIQASRWCVTTISTTIVDIVRAGVLPLVFEGQPFEAGGDFGSLPASICFRDTAGLEALLRAQTASAVAERLYETISDSFDAGAERVPEPSTFARLAKDHRATGTSPPSPSSS